MYSQYNGIYTPDQRLMTFIQKTQHIRKEGKINWFLLLRLRLMLMMSFIMGGIFAYNVLFENLNQLWALGLATVGFVLGFSLFAHMNIIEWDKNHNKISMSRMDILAGSIFVLYILFEVIVHTVFTTLFSQSAVVFILALAFGTVCGRTAALAFKIIHAYEQKT